MALTAYTKKRLHPRQLLSDSLSVRFLLDQETPDSQTSHDALIIDISESGAGLLTTFTQPALDQHLYLFNPQLGTEHKLDVIVRHARSMHDLFVFGVEVSDGSAEQFKALVSQHLDV